MTIGGTCSSHRAPATGQYPTCMAGEGGHFPLVLAGGLGAWKCGEGGQAVQGRRSSTLMTRRDVSVPGSLPLQAHAPPPPARRPPVGRGGCWKFGPPCRAIGGDRPAANIGCALLARPPGMQGGRGGGGAAMNRWTLVRKRQRREPPGPWASTTYPGVQAAPPVCPSGGGGGGATRCRCQAVSLEVWPGQYG
ncbi:hypothetical protein H696_00384 [Fonticula alba]|uniref:Uncharacterized protein n=1 Tax=Fonticula alba TaxID=691883 RepID=A0A058ZFS7_FONAL|nr:hypothetical protein H696_00384 [Fonticula alba]KCV72806.1 hypothetical protein H696_00384 [Fonticula alba]|eukprot:XP_009492507.1 hypothetical protein H696_00384 [Fonticula alba]